MKKLGLTTLLIASLALGSFIGIYAIAGNGNGNGPDGQGPPGQLKKGDDNTLTTDMLTGYQEATPAGVSTNATGTFTATIDDASQQINYTLTYSNLSSTATQAHIHFGNRYDSGGVSAFLCGPAPASTQTCPDAQTNTVVTVTGTITPSNVIGPAAQGIAAGQWDRIVAAMRAGVAYANVHTTNFPQGEIRGQINDTDQRQPE